MLPVAVAHFSSDDSAICYIVLSHWPHVAEQVRQQVAAHVASVKALLRTSGFVDYVTFPYDVRKTLRGSSKTKYCYKVRAVHCIVTSNYERC